MPFRNHRHPRRSAHDDDATLLVMADADVCYPLVARELRRGMETALEQLQLFWCWLRRL